MPDWTHVPYPSGGLIIDGVAYTTPALRRIIHERHELATEVSRQRDRLERADRLLRLRTAALVRLIAARGRATLPS